MFQYTRYLLLTMLKYWATDTDNNHATATKQQSFARFRVLLAVTIQKTLFNFFFLSYHNLVIYKAKLQVHQNIIFFKVREQTIVAG